MENLGKDKKTLTDGRTLDLLARLITLRKRNRQTNEKLHELKQKTDEFLNPDHKDEKDPDVGVAIIPLRH